jgi:hypothetical protein
VPVAGAENHENDNVSLLDSKNGEDGTDFEERLGLE